VVFSKTYSHKIPEFHNQIENSFNGIENNISFREGTVRYTKIRKEVHNDCNNKI